MFPLWRHSVNMGDFGADSQKSSWLYSSHACISHVDLFESTMVAATKKKLAATGVNGMTGKKTINGTEDLKGSQAYTPQFAWALTQAYLQNSATIRGVAKAVALRTLRTLRKDGPRELQKMDRACQWWKAAKLDQVFAYMGVDSDFA